MSTVYLFLASEGLVFLKKGFIPFYNTEQLPEPWLKLGSAYRLATAQVLSDQDFYNYLKQQYENLPAHVTAMVSFDYFFQQSQPNRSQIEHSISCQNSSAVEQALPMLAERLRDFRVLSLFEDWQNLSLWHSMAAAGQGMVVELNVPSFGFHHTDYNDHVQRYSAVNLVDSWLPDNDLYYLFNRPQSLSMDTTKAGERRLVRHVGAADRKVVLQDQEVAMYRLPPKAVARVILGFRCNADYCKSVKQYLSQDINYRHVECVQAQLNPSTLQLEQACID